MEPYAQTKRESEIVKFADENEKMTQAEIAKHFHIQRQYIGKVLSFYRPGRTTRQAGETSKLQSRIIDAINKHPDALQKDIAKMLGCDKCSVSQTVCRFFPERRQAHKSAHHKLRPGDTLRTCLKCGREFGSEWIGNRICGDCAESKEYQYIPNHSVCVEGHGRV